MSTKPFEINRLIGAACLHSEASTLHGQSCGNTLPLPIRKATEPKFKQAANAQQAGDLQSGEPSMAFPLPFAWAAAVMTPEHARQGAGGYVSTMQRAQESVASANVTCSAGTPAIEIGAHQFSVVTQPLTFNKRTVRAQDHRLGPCQRRCLAPPMPGPDMALPSPICATRLYSRQAGVTDASVAAASVLRTLAWPMACV